jgi:hypothetical protein
MPAKAGPKNSKIAKKNHVAMPKPTNHMMSQAPIAEPKPYKPGGGKAMEGPHGAAAAKVKKAKADGNRRKRNKGRS